MLFDGDTFEHKGRQFRVQFPYDQDADAPWENSDGHGPVTDWLARDKHPGERVLSSDRSRKRYYDFQEAMKIAKHDGWGLSKEAEAELAQALGREPTRGEITAQAVERDYEYLRQWCNDDWHYIGVVVCQVDDEGTELGESESLWSVEDNDNAYVQSIAHELADEICARLDCALRKQMVAERPDMYPAS